MNYEYFAYLALTLLGSVLLLKFFNVKLERRRIIKTLIVVAPVFVLWDVIAVLRGHWSFNPEFYIGLWVLNQPVEEILFFFVIPFFYIILWETVKSLKGAKQNA